MGQTRKTARRKTPAAKPGSGITKAKVKRIARKAKGSLDAAAHEAGLALRRAGRKFDTKFEEAKAPAKKRARRAKRTIVSAFESAGESITAAIRKAKSTFAATQRKSTRRIGTRRKGAT